MTIIAGTILESDLPTQAGGSKNFTGYKITKISNTPGYIRIDFDPVFSSIPGVTLNPIAPNGQNNIVTLREVTQAHVVFQIAILADKNIRRGFSFIATSGA